VLDAARQPERRALLATAVAFYERLAETDAADPVVRREAAKAQFRAGRAWLGLGETAKAAAAFDRAARLGDAAEAHVYLGHAHAIDARFAEALAAYTAGVDRAEAAWAKAADPADAVTLVTGLSALARYWGFQNPPKAADYTRRALALAEQLNPAPDAPPAHRLALAEAVLLAGDGHAQAGRRREAAAAYDRTDAVFRSLPPAAPAGMVEAYYRLKAAIPVQRGTARRWAGDPAGAVALIRQGLGPADALLAVSPNGFPYLVLKHGALLELAGACDKLGDAAGRDTADADRRRVADKLAVNPSGRYVLADGARRDSELLIDDVRAGRWSGFAAAAADLRRRADWHPRSDLGVRYNIACGHAQMAALGPPADREAQAVEAVRLLDELAAAGYFTPARAKHLAADPDLDPLRGRADFKAVAAKASRERERPE
jgi:tetratricopeptide (TPR) repeat protein